MGDEKRSRVVTARANLARSLTRLIRIASQQRILGPAGSRRAEAEQACLSAYLENLEEYVEAHLEAAQAKQVGEELLELKGRWDGREEELVVTCNCSYPAQRYRNGSGHHPGCPVQLEFEQRLKRKQGEEEQVGRLSGARGVWD